MAQLLSFIRTLENVRMNAAQPSPRSSRQSNAESAFRRSSAERGSEGISLSMACGVVNDIVQSKSKPLLSKKADVGWLSLFW